MRALVSNHPGLDQLMLIERDPPRPGPGQVLLRMRAAAVALRDYKVATGAYGVDASRGPLVLGGEGVGEVVECGADVTGWHPGQRVNRIGVALTLRQTQYAAPMESRRVRTGVMMPSGITRYGEPGRCCRGTWRSSRRCASR